MNVRGLSLPCQFFVKNHEPGVAGRGFQIACNPLVDPEISEKNFLENKIEEKKNESQKVLFKKIKLLF